MARACRAFPGHIIVGLDAKDGQVAIKGWAEITEHRVADLAQRFEQDGVSAIVYTDIGRDGMMTGPNIEATLALAGAIATPVIASGGITNLDDIAALVAAVGGWCQCDRRHHGPRHLRRHPGLRRRPAFGGWRFGIVDFM